MISMKNDREIKSEKKARVLERKLTFDHNMLISGSHVEGVRSPRRGLLGEDQGDQRSCDL